MVEIIKEQEYPKMRPDGNIIVVNPNNLSQMPLGTRDWFHPDGTAKSVSEMKGTKKIGPDDGEKLG